MGKLSGQKWIAISHLRAAYEALSQIPEEEAGPDHGNISSASDHIEAAAGRLGGTLHPHDTKEPTDG